MQERDAIQQIKTLVSLLLFQTEEMTVAAALCRQVLAENAPALLNQAAREIADSSQHPLRASFRTQKALVMAALDQGKDTDLSEALGAVSGISQQVLAQLRRP